MGGFIEVPGCIKAEVKQDMGGVDVINVLHFGFGGAGGTASDLNDLANRINLDWVATIIPLQSVDLELVGTTCTDLTTQTSPQGFDLSGTAGTATGDILSANAAACVSLRESFRYRGGHGRMYVAGAVQSTLDTPNQWTETYRVALETAAGNFRTDMNSRSFGGYGDITWVVLHARMAVDHPVPTPPVYRPPFFNPIVSTHVDSRVDSQRRRLGR